MSVWLFLNDEVQIFRVIMKLVPTHLITNPEEDEKTAQDAQRETGDVDDGVPFLPDEVSPGDFKIIAQHKTSPERGGGQGSDCLFPVPQPGGKQPSPLRHFAEEFLKITRASLAQVTWNTAFDDGGRQLWRMVS